MCSIQLEKKKMYLNTACGGKQKKFHYEKKAFSLIGVSIRNTGTDIHDSR